MKHTTGLHLHLVRHGESANNAQPEHKRVPDPALTELGQKQARQLAQHYADMENIDHVLVSPFRRTLQTAQPLLKVHGIRASIWPDIHEVGGCYEGHEPGSLIGHPGMTNMEISSEFPEFDIPQSIDEAGWYKSESYETWDMAMPRAEAQAQRIRKSFKEDGSVVFCFIHADFKQLLLQCLLPEQTDYHGGDISNSSVTYIHFNGSTCHVVYYCATDHLSAADVSY